MPQYLISRSETIDVSSEKAIEVAANFETWRTWSPWLMVEPEAIVEVSRPPNEVGSTYRWEGDICGAGQLTHQEVTPGKNVRCKLEFFRPMKSVCETEFTAVAVTKERCELTWTMRGKLPWFLFWMKGMMETFIGMDYERGLRMLKEYAETGQVSSKLEIVGVEQQPERKLIGLVGGATMDEIGEKMNQTMQQVDASLPDSDDRQTAAAFYHPTSDLRKRWFDFTAGYLFQRDPKQMVGSLVTETIPAGRYFVVRHVGCYQHLGNAWMGGVQMIRHHKLKMAKAGGYEIYQDSLEDDELDKDRVTDVYIPIK